jgi:hypothetical protein
MRIVSLTPSWTETLIEAGLEVVGRTRYCIHPTDRVDTIPIVGGTKELDWSAVTRLEPDLLILDQEENPRWMAEQSPVPWLASRVTEVADAPRELRRFADRMSSAAIADLADRYDEAVAAADARRHSLGLGIRREWLRLPGIIEWVRPPDREIHQLLYLIWRKPWMSVGPKTYIGSMIKLLGLGDLLLPTTERYPVVHPERFVPEHTLTLLSSEPFPFEARREAIEELAGPLAIVDGEAFGWFGIRSLRFLERVAGQTAARD